MTEAIPPETGNDRLLAERLRAVCATMPPMFAMNLFCTGLMAVVFWDAARATALTVWLTVNFCIVAARICASRAYLIGAWPWVRERHWPFVLTGFAALTGLSWGGPLAWMIATGSNDQIMVAVCVSFGALATATANTTYWPIFAAFTVPLTASAAAGFVLADRPQHWTMAAGALATAAVMLSVSRRLSGQVLRAMRTAQSYERLVGTLADRKRELEAAFAALERISRTDALTGLANRRARDDRLKREWSRAERMGTPLSVIAIDVDRFKRYNDTHGHEEGDRCLVAVAAMLSRATRGAMDMAARHGGEEFMLILPGLAEGPAASVAERLRVAIARCHDEFALPERVTVSLGVATVAPSVDDDLRGLTVSADAALYRAKLAGRNRYEVADAMRHSVGKDAVRAPVSG